MKDTSPAVRLLIKSGMVPEAVIRQLVSWRVLPEDSVEAHGTQKITLENEWETVDGFLNDLRQAISDEASTIRETILDSPGTFKRAELIFSDGKEEEKVFIDRLGRLVLDSEPRYEKLKQVRFDNKNFVTLKMEPRFQGKIQASWVVYLAEEE